MDNIKLAIHSLQDSISTENRRGKDVEDSLIRLDSTANLLKLSTIPPNTFKRISELLRQRLFPLYQVSLTRALQFSTAVLEFIQDEKLIPAIKAKNEPLKQLWERLLISLVSGVLDYLDQSPDTQSRESIASVFYPILTRIYFSPLAIFLSEINGGLLSAAYQLLVTAVEPQSRNAARLRDHGISSECLGLTLSQIRDFLAIESLLDIICTLIPPVKNGVQKRSQFIKEVFDPDLFLCSKSILQILESITDGDWSITAVKIIEALASSDISFPQPFNASSLKICGISVNTIAPFYVDKNGFLANLDQDGKLETLHVPFCTVTRIVGTSISNIEFSIVLVLSMPPVIGTEPLSVPSGRGFSVSWNLKKSQLGKFANVAKDRNLTFLNLTTKKSSLPGTHIAFNLPADKDPQELVSTQEKIHDMAKLLAMPSSPEFDLTEPKSPINQFSESRERKAENTTPSAELVTEIVEDNAAHQTVFLDHNGNLSFTDPLPVNEAFIQSLEDNTLLSISSTSELPRRLAQRSTKNQDNSTAITSRVTRSNNIAPQTVPKPPNGKPKKKIALTKKSPAVKPRSNKTTTLDAQLHNQVQSQGHSAVPINVDKLPESKETIPPSKTQKCRSATAGTMDKVTELLDEPRRHEDRSLETNISPVDLKPKNKKRAISNIEDSEVIQVAEQERPNKRTRMDLEKPSYPALSYQRKKYGRNGRISSPGGESPIPTVDFDEIPDPNHTEVIERPNSRASAMNGKRFGKKTEPKPAAPKKRKQEPQEVKLVVKPTAPKVPVSLAMAERDNQARESLSETDHHPVEQETMTGPEMKLDCQPTSLTKAPSLTWGINTEGHNENNARKKAQTAPWEDKNFLLKTEGAFALNRSPSTKEILVQKKDETWDPDHSLTLVVDDDDYEQEKEVVEPSTFEPDIDMIDLTVQDDPIPARIPINVFSKSSLKENKPMANVQLALHEKQTQKVKVEISSLHHLPTKDRYNRPSVSFALPVELQRYPWPETSTFARKQRTYLASKYREIQKSWEKSDPNKTTSRTVHQQRYLKAEEKTYEEPEEPIERIAEIIKQIGETVVQQISRRFDSVRDELHAGHRSILQGTLQHLEKMHEESTAHLANMVELEEEYALRCGHILKGFDDIRESSKNLASCVKIIVKEHNQQRLSKKFPPKLFDKRTGILLNATIAFDRLD